MIYLDNAATTWPKPESVYKEILYCMEHLGANPGRSGHQMAMAAGDKIYECRETICTLFNIPNPLGVAFTSNATEALNLGIKGILKPGDHVITTGMEHNSVLRPLMQMESKGITVSIVNADAFGKVHAKDIMKKITRKTKMIITTHASNVFGTIYPIEEIGYIAYKNNIIYMVDAAQTAGVIPIDVQQMHIDILAFPGHKGLLGPQGTGGIYIREGIKVLPLKEGGTGSMSESQYQPKELPDRYESGTLNAPGIAGLNQGIKYILQKGQRQILEHERTLVQHLLEGLKTIHKVKVYGTKDLYERVGVVSINIADKDCVEVCNILDEIYDIAVRGGLHCSYLAHQNLGTLERGTIRLSVGAFNTIAEIDMALTAIEDIAKNEYR